MRTTVTIDDSLYSQIKVLAAKSHDSVGSVLEDALRFYLLEHESRQLRPLADLPTWNAGQIAAGIDLNDNSAVFDFLDEVSGKNELY
jgi:predicted transcriptional regulator